MKPNLKKKLTEGGIISLISVIIIKRILILLSIPEEQHDEFIIFITPILHGVLNSLRVKLKHYLKSKSKK